MPNRRRTHWPLLIAALIVLPLLYFAGFGPAMWLAEKVRFARTSIAAIYWPLGRFAMRSGSSIREPLSRYLEFWKSPDGYMADGGVESIIFSVPIRPDDKWGGISYEQVHTLPVPAVRLSAQIQALEMWKRNREWDSESCEGE